MIDKETMLMAVEKYKLMRTDNIIYGTNIPKVKFILPTPIGTEVVFEETKFFFFVFDEKGIRIITTDLKFEYFFKWEDIKDVKISKFLIIGKLSFVYNGNKFVFQLNRFVFGNQWISNNTKLLESNNYYIKRDLHIS